MVPKCTGIFDGCLVASLAHVVGGIVIANAHLFRI